MRLSLLPSFLATLFLLLSQFSAQSTTATSSSASPSLLAVYPGDGRYKYAGCFNETTSVDGSSGARALSGGQMEDDDNLTPMSCFAYCNGYEFAGLQYGMLDAVRARRARRGLGGLNNVVADEDCIIGRECWCARYLNSLGTKLDDKKCDIPCAGNKSLACGGALKYDFYLSCAPLRS
jgi:hypothetical protein